MNNRKLELKRSIRLVNQVPVMFAGTDTQYGMLHINRPLHGFRGGRRNWYSIFVGDLMVASGDTVKETMSNAENLLAEQWAA